MMYFQKKDCAKKAKTYLSFVLNKYVCTLVKFVKFYYYVFACLLHYNQL